MSTAQLQIIQAIAGIAFFASVCGIGVVGMSLAATGGGKMGFVLGIVLTVLLGFCLMTNCTGHS